ncbi:MAG: hypothetical protein J7K23_05800 [Thermoproteales archaeon]|nr:hypothetical protein [Thermoproteales archaeon]
MIGSKKTIEFLAKYIASLILSVSPILASKLLMWFVWDPGLVLKSPLEFLCTVLSLAFEIAIYVTYVLGFLVPLAVLVRKPLYLITAFVFYTYAVETGGFGGPLGFLQIYSGLVTGYTFFFETLRKYTVDLRLLLSLALLVVSLHVYIRGEVRWR